VDLQHQWRSPHLPHPRSDVVKRWRRPGGLQGRRTIVLPSFEYLLLPVGYAPPCFCTFPCPGLLMMSSFPYYRFFFFRFPFLCVVLVIRSLESPGELLALVGGLPAFQSS
jgi:hypothetical protein